MKKIVTSDSTCDLSKDILEKFSIETMPLHILLGEEEFIDGVNIGPEKIYEYFDKTGTLPKTAARSTIDYEDFFKNAMKKHNADAIIHLSLSSFMSSSFNNAFIASQNLENVYVIDSQNLSTGTGLLVLSAIDKIKEKKSVQQIVSEITQQVPKVNASFVLDNLKFLYKGGRCSAVAAFGANLLQIKPKIAVNDGTMGVAKKYLGKFTTVILKYVADSIQENPNAIKKRIFITSTTVPDGITNEIEKLLHNAGFEEIIQTTAGCTITSHCGKNTIGVLFINN